MKISSLLGLVLVVLIGGGIIYAYSTGFVTTTPTPLTDADQVACTADAMQCPDGSWVGRSGPKCEFVCPTPSQDEGTSITTTLSAGLNQSAQGLGIIIVTLAILEDSRCPLNVQCIQAGTVRLRAQITSELGTNIQEFTLGTPVTTEDEIVTLSNVTPAPNSTRHITPNEYQFTFTVTKR